MKMGRACNLDVPAGATPMTIADAILRELDNDTLEEVLYYIDCFLKQHKPSDGNITDPCDGCQYELNSTNGNPCYSCGKYKMTEQQPCED